MKNRITKLSFMGFLLICEIGLYPTTAMEKSQMNIGDITPVKDGMSKEQAKNAILLFLKDEVLKPENEINEIDIISDTNKKFGTRGGTFRVIKLKDGTEWVEGNKGLQRFIGAHYLQKALDSHGLSERWHTVETKFIIKNTGGSITVHIKKSGDEPLKNLFTINSDDFTSFSKYVGNHRPTQEELLKVGHDFSSKYEVLHTCGYADFMENTNLRILEGERKVIVIDTEYASFKNANKVNPPSKSTEEELGGISFTFTKSELGIH